jgi:hypothetical protein
VAVVGGKELVQRCLKALCQQVDFSDTEIIVPYDKWSIDVGELALEFPSVCFHLIARLGAAESKSVTAHAHRLYDRRRAVGLSLARGRVIAMTEDYAVPATDWCRQVILAHKQPYSVIGGAIENAVDHPLNRALYFCDFGRYGRPFESGAAKYVSDVNLSYKREVLFAIQDVWRAAYHETTLHWALQSRGEVLYLDSRIVVFERRPQTTLRKALHERVEWGRVFAETRVQTLTTWQRFYFALGTVILPALLSFRVLRHMIRQRESVLRILQTLPVASFLLVGWAFGELTGYLSGRSQEQVTMASGMSAI